MPRNILHFNGEISVGSQMPFVIVAMFAGEGDPPAPCHFPFDRGLIVDKYSLFNEVSPT